jgi:hypothetical protein
VSWCYHYYNLNPASCYSSSSAAQATATVVTNREKALQQCNCRRLPSCCSSCCSSLLLDMLAERVDIIASTPMHTTENTPTAAKATSSDQTTWSTQHHRDWQCPARAAHTQAVLNSARERGITTGQKGKHTGSAHPNCEAGACCSTVLGVRQFYGMPGPFSDVKNKNRYIVTGPDSEPPRFSDVEEESLHCHGPRQRTTTV